MAKFLVFGYQDQNSHEGCSFQELGNLTLPSKVDYCKTHGYDFYLQEKDFDYSKKIAWARIKTIIEKIKENKWDWILYLDADTMICNHTIRLENLIDDNYDIIVSRNFSKQEYEINCGVMLVKCSDWSLKFLENLYTKSEFYDHVWAEQAAMMDELEKKSEIRSHFKFVHNRYFNSYYHAWYPQENFQLGDFICHIAGASNDFRFRFFSELKDNILKVNKVNFKHQPFNGTN